MDERRLDERGIRQGAEAWHAHAHVKLTHRMRGRKERLWCWLEVHSGSITRREGVRRVGWRCSQTLTRGRMGAV